MTRTILITLGIVLVGAGIPTCVGQASSGPAPRAGVVATLGDRTVTDTELEELVRRRLLRLRSEEYQIKRQALEELIARDLMQKEAKARGMSVEELQRAEIDARVLPVTEEQKRAVYESSPPQQFQGKTQTEAFAMIEANLTRIRVSEARKRFMAALWAKTPVKILIEPPRFAIDPADGPSIGSDGAPITIVEFSDFQCPACGRAVPVVKRLLQQYQGKVRLVFRDFPLPMHPQAPRAAEAGRCAAEQGRFWEMHDRMFMNQQKLAPGDLKASATELGLDPARFGSCLDSGRHASSVQRAVAAAREIGVSSTPTFFVNGRMIVGGASYQNLAEVVDEELQRAPLVNAH